jgi:hypothetical protein
MKEKDVYSNDVIVEGLRACENKRNKSFVESALGIYEKLHGRKPDTMFMSALGTVLENFRQWRHANLAEATNQASFPALRDYGFELLTALFPGLITNEIFTIQPAKFKNFSIFYQTFKYQTAKGITPANTPNFDALRYFPIDQNYTLDSEINKVIGTGTGATAAFSYNPAPFRPIVPGTVSVTSINTTNGAMALVDDGNNNMTGDGTGTVDYTTGVISVTFNANVKSGSPVLSSYQFIGEGSKENAAELGLTITEIQGQAKERRLRYNFSIESQFSYRQQWGRSMDADLLAAAMAEIRKEIDQDLIQLGNTTALDPASAGSVVWNRTPDVGVQYFFWREQFIDTLNAAGNLIVKATGFGEGNIVVGGLNFKQIVEIIGPRFTPSGVSGVKGSRFIGTIDGTRRCYYDPSLNDNSFFVTYKSPNPLEPGIVYSPWMPLFASDPHMLADGSLHRYLITSTGKTVINKKLFAAGTIVQS